MKRLVYLVALTVSIAARGNADRPSDEIKGLRACPASARQGQVQQGWIETPVRPRFSVSLPPECRHDSERRYVHGGDLWKCGSVSVEVVWGMWGSSSFSESSTKCAADVGGMRVMVVRETNARGPSLEVWYPIGEVHEPLVSAWGNRPEDLAIAEGVVFSGRVTAER